MANNSEPKCRGCRHFFVTYNPQRPWGCRALGFESPRMPSLVVAETSGVDCRAREPIVRQPSRTSPRRTPTHG